MAIADGQGETRGSPLTTIKRTQRSEEVRLQIERAIRAGDLHLAIAEASGVRLLYDLLSDLHSYLSESRHVALAPAGRPAKSASEHTLIVDAIVARDATLARLATTRHIASVRELVTANIEPEAADAAVRDGDTG